jgi:Family of unknown function (DUF6459)
VSTAAPRPPLRPISVEPPLRPTSFEPLLRPTSVEPPVRPPAPDALATVTELSRPGNRRERVPVASVQGTLALDLGLAGTPAEPRTPELRIVPGDGTPDHHEVQTWAARFAQATVEVLGGDRPLPQLLRWTSARVYADLDRRVRILGRAAPAPQRLRTVRPQVRSVHVCRPAPAIAEVSVHVRHGHRSRALAARLEHREGRWLCVALQLG